MNIWIDDQIYHLQAHGGISQLWRKLTPALQAALPDAAFDQQQAPDVFLSTYYQPAPDGVKSVVLVYDFIHECYPGLGANHPDALQKRAAIGAASEVVSISAYVARDCQRFTGRESTVAYCGGGEYKRATPAAVEAFCQRYQLRKPYVLTVGRRGLYKNIQAFYQAWGLWGRASHFDVLTIGGEDMLPADQWFDRRYPSTRRALRLSEAELQAAYSGAYALVYPSLYEGFGLPVAEALACGCPVITTRGGSLPEIGGSCVLYADAHRPATIASALDALSDVNTRYPLTLGGYEQARGFTWEQMGRDMAEVIRSVA